MFGKFSKKAKMAAAEAERNEAMKKALRDFSNFVKSFMNGKSDEQVDWLALQKKPLLSGITWLKSFQRRQSF